jgi:hypothetical protein
MENEHTAAKVSPVVRPQTTGAGMSMGKHLVDVQIAVLGRVVTHVRIRSSLEDVVLCAVNLLLRHKVCNIHNANAIMSVQSCDLVAGTLEHPCLQVVCIAIIQRLHAAERTSVKFNLNGAPHIEFQ